MSYNLFFIPFKRILDSTVAALVRRLTGAGKNLRF